MENAHSSPHRSYEEKRFTDSRRDYQINSSPPGWLLWCNPLTIARYGKINELGT